MKVMARTLAVATVLFGIAPYGFGMGLEVLKTEKFDLTIGGRAQLIAYAENVADPVRDNNRLYMFLKQARVNIHGAVQKVKYNTEWAYAAEDINTTNNNLTLLDFSFDVPLLNSERNWLKIGQFKVPYGRERLAYDGNLMFADRSTQSLGFTRGYDVGAALLTQSGKLSGTVGVFTAGGRDVPLRFLPEVLGFPLVAVRVGINDGADKDVYTVTQNDLDIEKKQWAAYLNGLYTHDTLIGHGLVLDIQTGEKSLLTNLNWNPYLKRTPLNRGDLFQVGWDAVYRAPCGGGTSWSSEIEMNHGEFSNRYGTIVLNGLRAQTGVLFNKKYEVALRGAALLPDDAFKNISGRQITGKVVVSEVVPALTWYLRGHDLKIVVDAPVLINVPVANETGVGSYVLTEQPDQTNSAGSGIHRRTVTQGRLMFQAAF